MNKLLFLFGCIGFRLLISFIIKNISKKYLPICSYITILPAIGFILLYLSNLRIKKGAFNNIVWWNKLRPIHGVMYLLFSIYAFKKETFAWKILLLDAILGLLFWLNHYYLNIEYF